MNNVKYFNGLEDADLGKYSEELNKKLIRVLEIEKGGEKVHSSFSIFPSSLEVDHWKRILSQRNNSLLISYSSAMFYYDKGIYDDDFFNNNNKINWENLLNYRYFIENFFVTASSILDNIAYILSELYNIQMCKISFKTILEKLNSKKIKYELKGTEKLINHLDEIRLKDNRYRNFNNIRNNIAHNNPPLVSTSPVEKMDNGVIAIGSGSYQSSDEVKKIMSDFLEVYVEMIDIILDISEKLNKN